MVAFSFGKCLFKVAYYGKVIRVHLNNKQQRYNVTYVPTYLHKHCFSSSDLHLLYKKLFLYIKTFGTK